MPTRPTSSARFLALACLAATLLAPAPGRAETFHHCTGFIDAVPAVLATQGVWCLRQDLATALNTGQIISIQTNNVTIDCNGY